MNVLQDTLLRYLILILLLPFKYPSVFTPGIIRKALSQKSKISGIILFYNICVYFIKFFLFFTLPLKSKLFKLLSSSFLTESYEFCKFGRRFELPIKQWDRWILKGKKSFMFKSARLKTCCNFLSKIEPIHMVIEKKYSANLGSRSKVN